MVLIKKLYVILYIYILYSKHDFIHILYTYISIILKHILSRQNKNATNTVTRAIIIFSGTN